MGKTYCFICGKITDNRVENHIDCYMWFCIECGNNTDIDFKDVECIVPRPDLDSMGNAAI